MLRSSHQCLSRLSTESVFLYDNQLTGSLPNFFSKDLTRLQAHENILSGGIPETLFFNTALEELRLDQNVFSGTISGRIGDLTALKDLRLNSNFFTGTLSATTARLSNLGKSHVFLPGLSATASRVSLFESTHPTPLLPFQSSWF
jgi:hypothetical protein